MKHLYWDNDHLILSLYIQPNARQNKVIGLHNDHIKIQISAPAVDNKANDYLQKWLAKEFNVPKFAVILLKGEHARQKTFCIKKPKQIPAWVNSPASKLS